MLVLSWLILKDNLVSIILIAEYLVTWRTADNWLSNIRANVLELVKNSSVWTAFLRSYPTSLKTYNSEVGTFVSTPFT